MRRCRKESSAYDDRAGPCTVPRPTSVTFYPAADRCRGNLAVAAGDPDAARTHFQPALDIRARLAATDPPGSLGVVRADAGRIPLASACIDVAISLCQGAFGLSGA